MDVSNSFEKFQGKAVKVSDKFLNDQIRRLWFINDPASIPARFFSKPNSCGERMGL